MGTLGLACLLVVSYLRRGREPLVVERLEVPPARDMPRASKGICARVIDGDTIELEGGERVRLIGVNAPESVDPRRPVEHFGEKAAEFTRRMAEGKAVRLEYDHELKDQYGRTLAYVFLPNGTFLNAEIIRQGYGFAYSRFPYHYQQDFVALEREAREQRRGLWGR